MKRKLRFLINCIFRAAAGAAAAVVLSACGAGDGRPTLTVAAASDVRLAFEEMEPTFEEACRCDVVFSFGSSGTLATQIEEGLPADAFFSANEAFVQRLERGGNVVPETTTLYAVGRIVVAVRRERAPAPSPEDLARAEINRVSLPNPEHAPYGLAGQEALRSLGIWEAVEPKLVLAENASQATAYVATGDADVGIVPLSLAIQSGGALAYTLIDDRLHSPLRQMAAVVAGADEAELAADFIAFVNGGGRETMEKYGFTVPED